jgi:hypothetical protein
VSDRLDHISQRKVIQLALWAGGKVELSLIDGEHVLALGDAIGLKPKLTLREWDAVGQSPCEQ